MYHKCPSYFDNSNTIYCTVYKSIDVTHVGMRENVMV